MTGDLLLFVEDGETRALVGTVDGDRGEVFAVFRPVEDVSVGDYL